MEPPPDPRSRDDRGSATLLPAPQGETRPRPPWCRSSVWARLKGNSRLERSSSGGRTEKPSGRSATREHLERTRGLSPGTRAQKQCDTHGSPGDQRPPHGVLAVRTAPHHHHAEVQRPLQVVGQQRALEAQHPPAGQLVAAGEGPGRLPAAGLHPERPGAVVPRPGAPGVGRPPRDALGPRPVDVGRGIERLFYVSSGLHTLVLLVLVLLVLVLLVLVLLVLVLLVLVLVLVLVLLVLVLQTGLLAVVRSTWFLRSPLQASSSLRSSVTLHRCDGGAGLGPAVTHGDDGGVTAWSDTRTRSILHELLPRDNVDSEVRGQT
ncbi:hypothetical protein EYF80_053718 [Liparis tanakae]|uniref:Uncharacterized protein n=1 Tax=Liparis tanakae TaxID=230148 RepID=A0A4Z2F6X5_9TELE|nr:hypothetical protein EYF80_053718 [Liparis tanakae]